MRKKRLVILILILVMGLCACDENPKDTELPYTPSEDSELETEKTQSREVVFLNRIVEPAISNTNNDGYSGIRDILEIDETYDEQTLFAYEVGWIDVTATESAYEILEREGFYFLREYSGEKLVVAGTRAQYEKVFVKGQLYEGYYWGADAAIRPDMKAIIKKFCIETAYSDKMYAQSWFDRNFEMLVPLLEKENNRVSLTVNVDTSWIHNDNSQEKKYIIAMKDVVFLNSVMTLMGDGINNTGNIVQTNSLLDYENVEETANDNTLYAFYVTKNIRELQVAQLPDETKREYQFRQDEINARYVVQRALELGIMVLENHSYCHYNASDIKDEYEKRALCVVVGTREQLRNLFEETKPINGNEIWTLKPALRPDYRDALLEVGASGKLSQITSKQRERLEALIGEEQRVTMKVPVMVPKQAE